LHGRLDWNDLRHFLAIARAGTLVGAARELGVEHTTVGRRLTALETALGTRLFTRGPSGFTLTDAGQQILGSVEAISEQVDSIRRRVSGGENRIAGTVRLTIPESGNVYFIQQLAGLRERHPELTVEIVSDNRALDLRRGEADLAVRFRDFNDPELIVKKLGHAGWSLYASEAYLEKRGPLKSIKDFRGHDVIGFDSSLSGIEGARWLQDNAGRDANIVLRGNSIAAVTTAAVHGLGIAPIPCFVAGLEPSLRRVAPELIGNREILVVVHPDLSKVARVRATIDYLVEIFLRDGALWSGVLDKKDSAKT
jgi:DNA-binding transcriptional LysR family regulator